MMFLPPERPATLTLLPQTSNGRGAVRITMTCGDETQIYEASIEEWSHALAKYGSPVDIKRIG
jgi:hypothetical protein